MECHTAQVVPEISRRKLAKWSNWHSMKSGNHLHLADLSQFSAFSDSLIFCSVGKNHIPIFEEVTFELRRKSFVCNSRQRLFARIQNRSVFNENVPIVQIAYASYGIA